MATALERLDISRTLFDAQLRPLLTEYSIGTRAVRYSWREIEQVVAGLAAETQAEGGPMFFRRTVADALDHTWHVRWSKAKGARKKKQLVDVVKKEVGAKPLSKFDYNALEEWINALQERDQSLATIKSKVSCVMKALKTVQPKGWIKAVPQVPELGEPKNTKVRWLTEDEERKLLDACGCQRPVVEVVMQHVIIAMVDTGARVSELLKVREDSLHLIRNEWFVKFEDRKAADDLMVPLTRRAEASIRWLLASRYWRARVRGVRQSDKRRDSAQNWVTHRFTEIRDHAGLKDVTAHTLRHTFASRLVMRGVDIFRVQRLMGHADIRMTMRYAHLAPSYLGDAIKVLEPAPANVTKLEDYRR